MASTSLKPSRSRDVLPGELFGGRFRIERELGAGGMGVVVAATDLVDGRIVALKFLHEASAGSVERFVREARAAAALLNPHVTRVFEVGETRAGRPFIVMEYLEGRTLAEVAASGASSSVAEVASWGSQVCSGLAEAHAKGIIHRDLKPANLFLTNHGTVKVLDFGVSKILDDEDTGLTTTGNIIGSPSFCAPEQLLHPRSVGPAADIWALGVTLYALLARELPFAGDNRVQVCMLVLNSTPVPLDELCHDAPRELSALVMQCLEKDPSARPPSVVDVARRLAPFLGATPVVAPGLAGFEPAAAPRLPVGDVPDVPTVDDPTTPMLDRIVDEPVVRGRSPVASSGRREKKDERKAPSGRRRYHAAAAVALFSTVGGVVAILGSRTQAARPSSLEAMTTASVLVPSGPGLPASVAGGGPTPLASSAPSTLLRPGRIRTSAPDARRDPRSYR